ncbi:hypothetical protein 2 [Changjiang crawfish virus 6]|uniref:hypothetical protein 2 n=1 Tax=Changjiang crawfish virus 6 TaxID=1922770 RepID=UPI000909B87F|nr:hypothetical protein 2 [Changjiang crawfish virus 6]APG79005.1 hypothetical protein 2 [Changjiang crawfish virus 6]
MGLAFCDYLYIHLEGDKLTSLNYENSLNSLKLIDNKVFSRTEVSCDLNGFNYCFCPQGYFAYHQRNPGFVFVEATNNDFSPIMKNYKDNAVYMDYNRILFDMIPCEWETTDIIRNTNTDQVNEIFVEKPIACSFTSSSGKESIFTPTEFNIWEFQVQQVRFRLTTFNMPEDLKTHFQNMSRFNLNYPPINQINKYDTRTSLPNLPKGVRQLVISVSPQYSVVETFRGRITSNTSTVHLLIKRLRQEFGSVTVEMIISNGFNGEPVIVVRCDLTEKDEECILFVRVKDKAPLYGTLRFPVQMLQVNSLQSVYSGNEQSFTDDDEFESNVIVANAGMAAAAIGGGLLSGLGQGLGQFYQTKAQMQMQEKYLSWQQLRQQYDIDNQKYLQQSMFDFKAHQQQNEFQYGQSQQQRSIDWAREQQSASFSQQNLYQRNQNQFTKELVEANLDSDIRRARNAQQLAGYRTDATVSGISFVSGRGGLGHPDAPQGVSLPPRSASTQTNSPKVYLTRPTGYYTGPLSNDERI